MRLNTTLGASVFVTEDHWIPLYGGTLTPAGSVAVGTWVVVCNALGISTVDVVLSVEVFPTKLSARDVVVLETESGTVKLGTAVVSGVAPTLWLWVAADGAADNDAAKTETRPEVFSGT